MDEELYRRFLGGDMSAMDELMLRYRSSLITYLNSYTHNIDDAEDMTMEAFALIMSKRPVLLHGNFKAYLYKTARNTTLRFIDRKSREQFVPDDDVLDSMADTEEGSLIEQSVTDKEWTGVLKECIDQLDSLTAEVIYLVYYEDMSYAQVAKVLKINEKKVDNLLVKGKGILKEKLKKEGITDAHR